MTTRLLGPGLKLKPAQMDLVVKSIAIAFVIEVMQSGIRKFEIEVAIRVKGGPQWRINDACGQQDAHIVGDLNIHTQIHTCDDAYLQPHCIVVQEVSAHWN